MNMHEEDLGMFRVAMEVRKLPRLKEEHIKLCPRYRMKVKYAVQVYIIYIYIYIYICIVVIIVVIKGVY